MTSAKTTMTHLSLAIVAALVGMALLSAPARAAFGIESFDGETLTETGQAFTQAGGHPYAETTTVSLNQTIDGVPEENLRNLDIELPRGFVANPFATPVRCSAGELAGGESETSPTGDCPDGAQVGIARVFFFGVVAYYPVYNMVPAPGEPAKLGFRVFKGIVHIGTALREVGGEYRLFATVRNASNAVPLVGSSLTLWGAPSDPMHDPFRGRCLSETTGLSTGLCPVNTSPVAFLTQPTACPPPEVGLETSLEAESWLGSKVNTSFISHQPGNPAIQQGPTGCAKVPFDPVAVAQPTSHEAETPSGLSFTLDLPDSGLRTPEGISQSTIRKAVVALPEGVTVNPSQASGLGACTPAQYASTELSFFSNPGCPSDSKIGTVVVHTPLLEEAIEGEVFVAQPRQNPFGSLLALYIVLKSPERGILVKLPAEVKPDPVTGQIVTTVDNLPQLPFSSFEFKFREGARSPLVTPATCGAYTTQADFTPWSGGPVSHSPSSFQITSGIGGAPCPSGGLPPFHPGLLAGSINNNAGSYSPFSVRLTRSDDEQEITHFSIKLPPGLTGKLAGIPFCSDAAIEASKTRTGAEELASPSCPAASEVGSTMAGAGVGSVPVYVPGKVYLAGPYHGSALSIAAITAAKVGPFDLGTVVVRDALEVNPETAEVFVDAAGSDPIPHIIDGVTTHLRDIRAYVDRPEFALNPTSCDRTSTVSTVLGSGLDFFSEADDRPFVASSPYQAANCQNLGFAPKLRFQLKGGTRRGAHPSLKAVLTMPPSNQANIRVVQVTLPRSEFLENAHFDTICTRVQFAAKQCPAGSAYGKAKAFTPLLDEPLEGPVYLRSSEHQLPDLVIALHSGKIEFNAVGRVDSVKGRLRSTFEAVPDAPVSRVVLQMQGGDKGLFVNSTNLCAGEHRVVARFTGHNGKIHDFNPPLSAGCGKGGSRHRRHSRSAG